MANIITGTAGSDTLAGTSGEDLIEGLGGDDDLKGGAGNDVLNGGSGRDMLNGGAGDDVLNGGDDGDWLSDHGDMNNAGGSETMNGDGGDDVLSIYRSHWEQGTTQILNGGDGNDRIDFDLNSFSHNPAATRVTIDGGSGNDRIEIRGAGFDADITLGTGRDTMWLGNLQSFLNKNGFYHATTMIVRDFAAGAGGDIIDWADVLPINLTNWDPDSNPFGSGHARLLQDGTDTLFQIDLDGGGDGDGYQTLMRFQNTLAASFTSANFSGYAPDGSPGVGQVLTGTGGNDTLTGTVGGDEIRGEAGNDTIQGLAGADYLFGGAGDDFIEGGLGDDVIEGGAGRDVLHGDQGGDIIRGGDDYDQISDYDSAGNYLYGEGGDDSLSMFYNYQREAGYTLLDGGDGNDVLGLTLYNSAAHIEAVGGAGNDRFIVALEAGLATLRLGTGSDTIRLEYYTSYGPITGNIVIKDFTAGDGGDQIEWLTYLPHVLAGWNAATNPFATGYLRLVQSGTSALLQMDANGGGDGYVTYITFENTRAAALTPYNLGTFDAGMVFGTEGADTLQGTDGDDDLRALGGNDVIYATSGHDLIDGGTGSDQLRAWLNLPAGAHSYTVTADHISDASGTLDTSFTGIEAISILDTSSTTGNVTINAGTLGNVALGIQLGVGTHNVTGGAGNDLITLLGGSGTFDGGAGSDRLTIQISTLVDANPLTVTEVNGVKTVTRSGAGDLTARNIEDIDISTTGGALRVDASTASGTFRFFTSIYADTVVGGAGETQIYSTGFAVGAGDVFTGGGGNDLFIFGSFTAMHGATITDFSPGDWLDLGQIPGVRYIGTAAFSGTAGEVRYVAGNGQTLVIGDANGDGVGDSVLTLSNRAMTLSGISGGSNILRTETNMVTGSAASETITGTTGDDAISALGGNDTIRVTRGFDTVDGGTGTDTLAVDAALLDLGTGTHSYVFGPGRVAGGAGAFESSFTAVERVSLADTTGNNVVLDASGLSGATLSVSLLGGTHNVIGSAGGDAITVGGGSGTIDTGAGNDAVSLSVDFNANGNVLVISQSGAATVMHQAGGPNLSITNAETMGVSARLGSALNADASASSAGINFNLGAGADRAIGGTGNDIFVFFGAGTGMGDVLTGGAGADSFNFSAFSGFNGATITDLGTDDVIKFTGQAGSIQYIGTAEFSGRAGEYRYVAGAGVTALLGDADGDGVADNVLLISNGAFVLGETAQGVLRIIGQMPPNDTGDNVVTGTDGVDYIDTGLGNDTVDGRGGNDVINAGEGDDHVVGGAGSDMIHGDDGNDVIDGGADTDSIFGDDGDDILTGTGNASDTDPGGLGRDWISGGNGNDRIAAANGAFALFGDDGDDTITMSSGRGSTWIDGGAGNDMISVFGTGNITLDGNVGDDVIAINGFSTGSVSLGAGNDELHIGGGGGYTLRMGEDFGTGRDKVFVQALNSGLNIIGFSPGEEGDVLDLSAFGADPFGTGALTFGRNGPDSTITIAATGVRITLQGINYVNLSAFNLSVANPYFAPIGYTLDDNYADQPTFPSNNTLHGADGNDTLRGFGGDDTLYGAGGSDKLYGGEGNDLIFGGSGNDELYGDAGDDELHGGSGDDQLHGGSGIDRLYGGSGDDRFNITAPGAQIFENAGEGNDIVSTSVDFALAEGQAIEQLIADDQFSTAPLVLAGNEFANTIVGNAGANDLDGGAGNDTLNGFGGEDWLRGGAGDDLLSGGDGHDSVWGGDGNDMLDGGAGDDTLSGGAGIDTVSYESAASGVTVDLGWLEDQNTQGAGIDTLTSIENLTGSGFADRLSGNADANWLRGGTGEDVLIGGGGDDTLTGGGDADVFVFGPGSGNDRITDFEAGTDKIDLSAYGFTSFAQIQALMQDRGPSGVWAGGAGFALGNGDSLVLAGVPLAQLDADDFLFAGQPQAAVHSEPFDSLSLHLV